MLSVIMVSYSLINQYQISKGYAECDAFFCFTNLMAEHRDNFIRSLDNSVCGIG